MPFVRPHRRTHAFTLLELLAVMAILLILAGFSFGLIRGVKQRANLARARAELSHLAQALEEYKRYYGDYPQAGPSATRSQIFEENPTTGVSPGPGLPSAQARLLNSLMGGYAANPSTRVNGPTFLNVEKLSLEIPFSSDKKITPNVRTTFCVPTGSPPTKSLANNSLIDPWGNRYMYFYKVAVAPGGGRSNWTAASYLLYSTGPRGGLPTSTGVVGVNANSGAVQWPISTGNDTNADYVFADKLP